MLEHLNVPLIYFHHLTDDQALGKVASHARGKHDVPFVHSVFLRDQVHQQIPANLPSDCSCSPRCLNEGADRTGGVNDEQNFGPVGTHFRDATHESPVGDHWHSAGDALLGACVNDQIALEIARIAPDHPCSDLGSLVVVIRVDLGEVEQSTQDLVFFSVFLQAHVFNGQTRVFGFQLLVALAKFA